MDPSNSLCEANALSLRLRSWDIGLIPASLKASFLSGLLGVRWEKLGILAMLPETFAVQSSTSNRQQFYFYYPKESDCPLYDPETGMDIGHIRGTGDEAGRGGMVVGPGSLHPSGVRYTVVRNVPIAHLSREVLEKIKEILRKPNGSKNCECNNETSAEKANVITIRETDPFSNVTCTQVLGSDWSWHNEGSQKAGPNPYGIHSNKTGHNLVVTEDDKQFYCFACQQGGGVSRLTAIKAGIMRCNQPGSPTDEDWWNTIKYALKEGLIDEAAATAAGLNQDGAAKERNVPTLEDALLAIDKDCDCATSNDHKGFNKFDAIFGKEMASKVRSGLRLTPDEYKDVRKMLEKYNKQLVEHGIDIRRSRRNNRWKRLSKGTSRKKSQLHLR